MTKEEAIRAMSEGKKVRHRYFSKDEWVTINSSGLYEFEDGIKVDSSLFWMEDRIPIGMMDGAQFNFK